MKSTFAFVLCLLLAITAIFFGLITVFDLYDGRRPTVYYAAEYFVSPTKQVEGKVESIELVKTQIRKHLFNRLYFAREYYSVKIDTVPRELIFCSYVFPAEKRDPPYKKGMRVKIFFHESVVPWEKDRQPSIVDLICCTSTE